MIDYEVILLAAGRSRRMAGIDKLLLAVDGEAMVRRSARLYLDAGMTVTVVTRPDNAALTAALAGLAVRQIVNSDPASADPVAGQHSSVRAGLLGTRMVAAGVVIALADQPLLTANDIAALANEFLKHDRQRICVPRFGGQRGNPVILPVAIARRLRDPDAMPARAFIDAHPDQVAWFDAANDHFTRDIDTREDAARLVGLPDTAPPGS